MQRYWPRVILKDWMITLPDPDNAFVEEKVKKLKRELGKDFEFKLSKLNVLDIYRAGLYGGIKFGRENRTNEVFT